MKRAILALLLTCAAAAAPAPDLADMSAGRFTVKLDGILCTACTRAIVQELAKLKEVQAASADFGKSEILVTVKLDKTLTVSALKRALRRAARRVNLDTRYEIRSINYRAI